MDLMQALGIAQIANALALAALLTILASGLALIFGLRDVMNFAHGALYMLGAYLGHSIAARLNFWAALALVPIVLGVMGVGFEYGVLRPLRRRSHMEVALVTFGLSMIVTPAVTQVWGKAHLMVALPTALAGSLDLFGEPYPVYRLFLIGIGLSSCLGLAGWLKWTRLGMHTRAVSQQPEVARMMGVNTDRLSLIVVCLGTAFAGLAGVLAGPYLSVDPGMGSSILITCLVVVVVGGLGSVGGAILAALAYGFVQVIGSILLPSVAALAPYVMLFVVLLVRPQGFGRGRVA